MNIEHVDLTARRLVDGYHYAAKAPKLAAKCSPPIATGEIREIKTSDPEYMDTVKDPQFGDIIDYQRLRKA